MFYHLILLFVIVVLIGGCSLIQSQRQPISVEKEILVPSESYDIEEEEAVDIKFTPLKEVNQQFQSNFRSWARGIFKNLRTLDEESLRTMQEESEGPETIRPILFGKKSKIIALLKVEYEFASKPNLNKNLDKFYEVNFHGRVLLEDPENLNEIASATFSAHSTDDKCFSAYSVHSTDREMNDKVWEAVVVQLNEKLLPQILSYHQEDVSIRIMAENVSDMPRDIKKRLKGALEFFREKQVEAACREIKECVKVDSSSVVLNYNCGVCREIDNNLPCAKYFYKKAHELPKSAEQARLIQDALSRMNIILGP